MPAVIASNGGNRHIRGGCSDERTFEDAGSLGQPNRFRRRHRSGRFVAAGWMDGGRDRFFMCTARLHRAGAEDRHRREDAGDRQDRHGDEERPHDDRQPLHDGRHSKLQAAIDIRPRRHTLSGAAYAWRLAGLILGAEERGNQLSDGLPPSGVNPARSW